MQKNVVLFVLIGFILFVAHGLSVSAEDSGCEKLFESNCAECHGLDRGCKLLGQSPKEWESLFKFMEGMGADIDRKELLIECLSKPGAAVKAICSK